MRLKEKITTFVSQLTRWGDKKPQTIKVGKPPIFRK